MPFIFVSYSHKDSEYAHRLAASLEAKGLEAWIDERIDYGSRWPHAIQENLDKCAAFVVVMTPDSFESEWVQNELAYAIGMRKPIFPVKLAGPIWLAVASRLVVSVTGGDLPPTSFYSRLAAVLLPVKTQAPPSTHLRERLQTELGELQGRYDNLTRRIAAVDTDLGRALDGEYKLTLEERRADLAGKRDEISARMAQIEKDLRHALASKKKQLPPSPVKELDAPELVIITYPIYLELVRVPAGEFFMGSDPARDSLASDHEKPQHRLFLPEFYIGATPVTNAQYAVFIEATGHRVPNHWVNGQIPVDKAKHPVVHVWWEDLAVFCQWLSEATDWSFRLPTEAEWEKAARGTDGRIFPWGDHQPTHELCNFEDCRIGETTPVDRYLFGASLCGALDMSGNVWEWTSSRWGTSLTKPSFQYPYKPDDGREVLTSGDRRVLRGGSFVDNGQNVRCAVRGRVNLNDWKENYGFRVCAVTQQA